MSRNDPQQIEELLDALGDTVSQKARQGAKNWATELRTEAQDLISQKCKGSVNREFPGEYSQKTLQEIYKADQAGAEKAHKA